MEFVCFDDDTTEVRREWEQFQGSLRTQPDHIQRQIAGFLGRARQLVKARRASVLEKHAVAAMWRRTMGIEPTGRYLSASPDRF